MKYLKYIIGIISLFLGIELTFNLVKVGENSINAGFGCMFILFADLYLVETRGDKNE